MSEAVEEPYLDADSCSPHPVVSWSYPWGVPAYCGRDISWQSHLEGVSLLAILGPLQEKIMPTG